MQAYYLSKVVGFCRKDSLEAFMVLVRISSKAFGHVAVTELITGGIV